MAGEDHTPCLGDRLAGNLSHHTEAKVDPARLMNRADGQRLGLTADEHGTDDP
jgi:hypothetical protein